MIVRSRLYTDDAGRFISMFFLLLLLLFGINTHTGEFFSNIDSNK